jgi:Fe-S oxidoreductase
MTLELNPVTATDNCRYCLMCRHVCPVGHVTRLESLTPHGWGLLIASERRGLVTWNASAVDKLYNCADCGTCRSHCVTDQPLPEAIAAARAEVVAKQLAPAAVYAIDESIRQWGNPYQPAASQPVQAKGAVALFVGDEAAYLWPAALEAALVLLKAAGVDPVLFGAGRNSGYVSSSLGFPETARVLAQATLEDLQTCGATTVLVLGPGDAFVFRQLYGERLGVTWPQDVAVQELTVWLADKLAAGMLSLRKAPPGPPYAYVDPAHTVRIPERFAAPRRLLEAVMPQPGIELFWRQERSHPVGSTSLKFANPELARHLTYARLGDAAQSGARLLIAEDPGTLSALEAHAARFGLRIQGLYELLASHLA